MDFALRQQDFTPSLCHAMGGGLLIITKVAVALALLTGPLISWAVLPAESAMSPAECTGSVLVVDIVPLHSPQTTQIQFCRDGWAVELRFLQNRRLVVHMSAGPVEPTLVNDLLTTLQQGGFRNSTGTGRSRRQYPIEDDVVRISFSGAENRTSFRSGPLSELPTEVAAVIDRLRSLATSLPEAVTVPLYIRAEPVGAARVAALRASPTLEWAAIEEFGPRARSAVEDALRLPFALVPIEDANFRLTPTLQFLEDLFLEAEGGAFQLELYRKKP